MPYVCMHGLCNTRGFTLGELGALLEGGSFRAILQV